MKKTLILSLVLVCLFHGISDAQTTDGQTFINAFFPESSYYEGHHCNSNYLLDTLYWSEWYNGSGGYHYLLNYKYIFTYLPDGNVYQIMQYAYFQDYNQWGQSYRYSFDYDEDGRLTSYRSEQQKPDGQWQYYTIKEYTYDNQDRVSVILQTNWAGEGYEDSHKEFQYEYDEDGHLLREAIYLPDQGRYYFRFLYEYENDNLTSEYYQRWLPSSGWTDIDWYQFSYVNGKISDMIHQIWNSSEQNWYNYEKQTYEYHPEEERAYIISQSWDDEWINRYRATNFISNGRLVIDSTQKWQNEEWVDFTACEYSFDGSGNFTEAKWKDYVDGEWVDSDYNTKTIVSYNDGVSILCDYIQSFRARYISTDSTSELYTTNQTTIFPNPGTNQFTIQADTPFTHVIVYDMTGLQIFSQSVSETAIRINTESWPSGIYFWKAYNSNSAQCGKWVKN